MKAKTVISAILLAFVIGSVAYLVFDETRPVPTATAVEPAAEATTEAETLLEPAAETETAAAAPPETPPQQSPGTPATSDPEHEPSTVIAYYFHGTKRCRTCMNIQSCTDQTLKLNFADQLGTGLLEWRVINVDEPENEHFIKDFQLTTRSVVLVEMRDGKQLRWKNLIKVWELVHDEPAFASYIAEETLSFLGGQND